MRPILSTYQEFSKYCFNNRCFQLPQNVTSTDKITRLIRHKWCKFGPPYLLSDNGDLSFLFDTVPGREDSRKVSKTFFGNFYF